MCNPRMALMLVPAHLMYIKWTHSDVMAYTQAFTHALHCVRRTVHLCYDNLSVAHSLTYSHTHTCQTNERLKIERATSSSMKMRMKHTSTTLTQTQYHNTITLEHIQSPLGKKHIKRSLGTHRFPDVR